MKHFPERNQLVSVLSFIVFSVYSWAIYSFLYQVPSSLLNEGVGEIAAILCYEMAFALLESLIVCGVIVLLCIIFPREWLCEGFVYKGFLIIMGWIAASALLRQYNGYPLPGFAYVELILCLVASIALILFFNKYAKGRKILLAIIERFGVFAYLYLPLGMIGLIVVLVRNLF